MHIYIYSYYHIFILFSKNTLKVISKLAQYERNVLSTLKMIAIRCFLAFLKPQLEKLSSRLLGLQVQSLVPLA